MMGDHDHVVLKFDEWGKGSVVVNGYELKSTLGVTMEANGGETTIVTIRMLASVEADLLVADTVRQQSKMLVYKVFDLFANDPNGDL